MKLANGNVSFEFDGRTGSLVAIENLRGGRTRRMGWIPHLAAIPCMRPGRGALDGFATRIDQRQAPHDAHPRAADDCLSQPQDTGA